MKTKPYKELELIDYSHEKEIKGVLKSIGDISVCFAEPITHEFDIGEGLKEITEELRYLEKEEVVKPQITFEDIVKALGEFEERILKEGTDHLLQLNSIPRSSIESAADFFISEIFCE